MKSLMQVLAVNQKQLESLIKVLYAAVAVIATDQVNKKVAQTASGWATSAKGVEKELGIEFLPTLLQIIRSGEVDDDVLIPEAKQFRRLIGSELKSDTSIDHQELEMVKALSTYLVSRSEGALKKAVQLLPALEERDLIDAFIFEAKSQKEFVKPLQKIVYAATKDKNRIALTAEEGQQLKASHPAVYKEYLRLRKQFNQVWKDELRNLVFESKKKLIKFQDALDYLDQQGIQHTLPRGFVGLIDANGKLYTVAGKGIAGLPGPGFSVQMNPDYNPKTDDSYVFTTINDATGARSQHVYTEDYRKQATQQKFEKVKNLDKVIDAVRKKWLVNVRKGGTTPEVVASTILELLYQFSARVGSTGNQAEGQNTYGISTLLGKHFKVNGNKVTISYIGKGGVKQIHQLDGSSAESKMLIRNIKELLEGKGPKDRVFTFTGKSGRELPMTGALVNRYFQKLGSPVTVHKLRHVRGTRLFNELLAANEDKIFNAKKPLSEAQAVALFKKLATQVGEMLGHVRGVGKQQKVTPATAIKSYLDPMVMIGFFEKLGYRPPKGLKELIR